MSSTGIVPINGGSVVLRTYLDESANNTYLLGQYDNPLPANKVLVTSTHGLLISTTTVNVSSVSVSSIFANTISTNQLFICTIYYSTFTSSQLNYHSTIVNNLFTPTITFITMSGGTVSSQEVTSMTLGVNQGIFSTIIAPSLIVSSANVYELSTINGTFSTLIGTNMTLSSLSTVLLSISSVFAGLISTPIISSITLRASTIIVGNDTFSDAIGNVLATSTLTVSSIVTDSVVFSTMVLGSLSTSYLVASSIYQLTGGFSTQIGSTVITSTFFTPALNVFDTQTICSMIGSSIVISTLTASTLYGGNQFFTVLTGNSTTATNMIATSMITSSIQFSTMYGVTATIPLIYASTLIFPTSYIDSTFSVSTTITTNTYTSSMITDSISINNYYINQPVYGQTVKKDSIDVFTNVGIYVRQYRTDFIARTDNLPSITQIYTFGSTIQNQWIIAGRRNFLGNASISNNGTAWTRNDLPYLTSVSGIVWSGNQWIAGGAGGLGTSSIITSPDSINWTSRGNILRSYNSLPQLTISNVTSVYWWPALAFITGNEYNSGPRIGFSNDNGQNWNNISGLLTYFTEYQQWNAIAYNGSRAVVVGGNDITRNVAIAWSDDPLSGNVNAWNPVEGLSAIIASGLAVIWTGRRWIVGGISNIVYSLDGITWTASSNAAAVLGGTAGIGWNGTMLVAVGGGLNTIAYSMDEGITWIGRGRTIFTNSGNCVTWNGQMWVAGGYGTNTVAYSYDGINWIGGGLVSPDFFANCIAFNFRRPYIFYCSDNQSVANYGSIPGSNYPIVVPAGSQLDVVSEPYYNSGYTNFSAVFQTNAI